MSFGNESARAWRSAFEMTVRAAGPALLLPGELALGEPPPAGFAIDMEREPFAFAY